MKCQVVLPACLLLLWTLTAFVKCGGPDIQVTSIYGAIVVTCPEKYKFKDDNDNKKKLDYNDTNTGQYTCVIGADDTATEPKELNIYVKFRSCDNCVDLDNASIIGLIIGNVVATTVMGVAVYIVASQIRSGSTTSRKKSSDRQHLVPNEVSNRAPNDHYQPLRHKGGQKETYDVLSNRR